MEAFFRKNVVISASGRPATIDNETILCAYSKVGIYEGEEKRLDYNDGRLYTTSHRLIWIDEAHSIETDLKYITGLETTAKFLRSSAKIIIQLSLSSSHTQLPQAWICNICTHSNRANIKCTECGTKKAIAIEIACSQCTYNNPPRSAVCEMCHSKLLVSETKYETRSIQIKFSFRDNGCTETFNFLKNNLHTKSWEIYSESTHSPKKSSTRIQSGIAGIIQSVEYTASERQGTMSNAFTDLEALMAKASEMVKLANTMSIKLNDASKNNEAQDDDINMLNTLISNLGLSNQPIMKYATSSNSNDDELSRQLSDFLDVLLPKTQGMIPLVDTFYFFNKSRRSGMVTPEDLLRACQNLERLKLPYTLRCLRSGLLVLQKCSISDEEIAQQVKSFVCMAENIGATYTELSALMDISVFMASEYVIIAEEKGLICRDDSIEGVRYYPNKILE